MRNKFLILVLAAVLAAVVVPVGFALSRDDSSMDARSLTSRDSEPSSLGLPAVVINAGDRTVAFLPALSDTAKLFLFGTVLFGLAAAVRRAA